MYIHLQAVQTDTFQFGMVKVTQILLITPEAWLIKAALLALAISTNSAGNRYINKQHS